MSIVFVNVFCLWQNFDW